MDYAVVNVPAAPVRLKPRHQREMVNQLLFGEKVRIIKEKGDLWVKVQSLHDNYEGWMTHNLLQAISETEAKTAATYIASGIINTVTINQSSLQIPAGAYLNHYKDRNGKNGTTGYRFEGEITDSMTVQPSAALAEQLTKRWLNVPYLWGGRTVFGIDCSGFVQVNFKLMGIPLPRDAWQQAQEGEPVKKLKDAVTGDLAFFDDKDEIVHVGMLLNSEEITHAWGKVRIDHMDKKGIIHSETGKRTHQLKAIRRYW